MYDIIDETEKAVKVVSTTLEERYNHVTEEDYKCKGYTYTWIPKSLCKIENNKVVEIAEWFALKNNLLFTLPTVEINGRTFVKAVLLRNAKLLKELGLTKEEVEKM